VQLLFAEMIENFNHHYKIENQKRNLLRSSRKN